MLPSINTERLLNSLLDMVRLPSPSYREELVFQYIRESLNSIGIQSELHSYGEGKNLYAAIESTDKTLPGILLSAHTDTVLPCDPILPIIKDGRLQSDGTSILGGDNKAGIAVIMEALQVIIEYNLPHGRIELFFSSAEEVGLQGAKHIDLERITSRLAVVLDSSGSPGTVISSSPAHDIFTIRVKGKKSHAGISPEDGINAIKAAGALINAFPAGRLDKYSVSNFGVIGGGIARNVVPDDVKIQGEIRSHKIKLLEKYGNQLTNLCRKIAGKTGSKISINIKREYDGFLTEAGNPLLIGFKNACRAAGIPCTTKPAGGGSDANILNSMNINCLNLACGMYNIHTNEEYVEINELEQMSALLALMITEFIAPQTASE